MANPLPDRVLPHELAERRQVIDFEGKIGDFERLSGIVEADLAALERAARPRAWRESPVAFRLEFAWLDRDGGLPAVKGHIDAVVTAVCQRCLEAFELSVRTDFELVFTDAAAADETPVGNEVETWELSDDTVRPLDVIEESLIMALPLAPVHVTASDCGPLAGGIPQSAPDTVRPFADLRSQMDELDK